MRREQKKVTAWWALIALTVVFIWGQSLLDQDLSQWQSDSVQGLLGQLFGEWIYSSFIYQYVRKVAHFAEYALLGMELMGCRLATRGAARPSRWALALVGPAVACADELLQFVSARAPRVTDVLLDCAGYMTGLTVVFGVVYVWRCVREKYCAAK